VARMKPKPGQEALTLRDVARLAGVSASTASIALAGSERVSPKTREAVRRAAAQLNYIPNSQGRALRSRRAGALALVIPHTSHHVFTHPVFMDLLEGITAAANDRELTTIVSTSTEADEGAPAYLRIMQARQADGIIVASASAIDDNVDRLIASGYPVTLIGRRPQRPTLHCIGIDDIDGGRQATEHLVSAHGYRRVAHISGPLEHQSAVDKLEGYRSVLGKAGIPFNESLLVESDYTQEGGYEACLKLLDGEHPQAIFAANDQMALGAVEAMRERGLDAPRDIAIVGYDDIDLARVMQPPLTTVRADLVMVGRLAAERLIALLDGELPTPVQRELPTTLVVRASCGCAASPRSAS
jgi:DNA-binding LacI/PurR family transcriptional regulator